MRDDDVEIRAGGSSMPYSVAGLYVHRGWDGVLPLPARQKAPPPDGFTGANGGWPDDDVIQGWISTRSDANIALRLPANVVGIDVDAYGDKRGDRTIEECEGRWGPLPPTWVSTSRGVGPSGIRLYRMPDGYSTSDWPNQVGPDVEVIRTAHRYAVVAPSRHPEGREYCWFSPNGDLSGLPPSPDDLAVLPEEWALAQTRPRAVREVSGRLASRDRRGEAKEWIATLPTGAMCPKMAALAVEGEQSATRAYGSAHDNTLASLGSLLRAADRGHLGVGEAVSVLRGSFVATVSDRQSPERAAAEFDQMAADIAASVMSTPDEYSRTGCDCVCSVDPDLVMLDRRETLPLFPTAAFPAWLRGAVEEVSRYTQTPAELAATVALGVLASCAGGRTVVEVREGWREPTNLFLVVAMPPGSRKSAVFTVMTEPLLAVEADLAGRAASEILEAETAREIALKAAEAAKQKAGRADSAERANLVAEAVAAAALADALDIPVSPRLFADDATPESVATLLAQQQGRLAILSTEGGIFDTIGGRYTGGIPSLDVFLKGHAGDPIRIDRKGRPAEFIKHPALTMCLAVQPVVLEGMGSNRAFDGRGLLARFLYAMPPNNVGRREVGVPGAAGEVMRLYDHSVRHMATCLHGWTDPARLLLSPEAVEVHLAFERAIEPRLAPHGDLGGMAEWGAKAAGAAARIAGLLHLAEDPERGHRDAISGEAMSRAVEIIEFYIAHSRVALRALNADRRVERIDDVWAHLLRGDRDEFTLRDLQRNLSRTRFPSISDVMEAVESLEERGYVIPLPAPERSGPGRTPSPRYRINPKARVVASASDRPELNSVDSAEPRKRVPGEGSERD